MLTVPSAGPPTRPLRTNDIVEAPELDYSDTSPINATSPRTPTLADLPRNISSQLACWSTNCDPTNDFQARNAMRYQLARDSAQWRAGRMTAESSMGKSEHTATYAPSTRSFPQPPSVVSDYAPPHGAGIGPVPAYMHNDYMASHHSYSVAPSSHTTCASTYSIQPPSLIMSGMSATSAADTIRNGLPLPFAKHLPDLEEDQEMSYLNDDYEPSQVENPAYPCAFWFLDCAFSSTSITEWKTHCLSHFRRNGPPKSASCPLCPFTVKGADAWDRRMDHVAHAHHARGEGLEASKPDFAMFKWLWKKRLISNAMLKELEGDFEGRSGQVLSTDTEGRATEERREAPVLRRLV